MPDWKTVYGEPFDEEKWKQAKARAVEEGHEDDWPYVVGIYKRMARTGEYKPKFSRQREKKKQTVDEWKTDNPTWEKKAAVPTHKSMSDRHMKLVLTKGVLDEFRCGCCNSLLFKGLNLEKSLIEVKCRSCGALLVSEELLMVQ